MILFCFVQELTSAQYAQKQECLPSEQEERLVQLCGVNFTRLYVQFVMTSHLPS